ncbi:Inosine triphosphate pyrophosphatase [Neolecta irregularis DAH-3]|uniref:Inosine triphosphate pyrophosphatase n=1 Tax=Neolecta irregularis (strain DAH-3) TaxID=1198029 RepID=A0A1U7LJZ4_NEOID|nr:Inosine triphosphate pyrophosphatase [Neolecta irregularis DAH-3]|eukprot:OLL22913.1 Inosine triphosphate pyrophosphatase [Neolecta irregularis DAH-3]
MANQIPVFVTGNLKKLQEVQEILGPTFAITSHSLDLDEIQGTTRDVAKAKCRKAAEILRRPVITEDTCLAFDALGGLPGPYIKWFMQNIGHEGLNNLLANYDDKGAKAICTFAYCKGPGEEVVLFEGLTEGFIVPARGSGKFGWDAVFQPRNFDETYAEMDKSTKNLISHRYKALCKLKEFLKP